MGPGGSSANGNNPFSTQSSALASTQCREPHRALRLLGARCRDAKLEERFGQNLHH